MGQKLTDRSAFAGTLASGDVIHIVDVSDTTQSPAGSSYKLTLAQLSAFFGITPVTTINLTYTGDSTIDLLGYSGELIINLTSANAAEDFYFFVNFTNVTKVTLYPTGFDLTVYDQPASNLRIAAPNVYLYGNKKGYIEFTKRADGTFYQTQYLDQYN